MKKSLPLIFSIATALLLCYSCTESKHSESKLKPLSEVNTIDRATYDNWKGAWKEDGQDFTANTLLEYFTMDLIDLQEFATHPESAARFYLGLDTTVTPSIPHLMLVGVDSTGQTILPSPSTPNAKIYDFTRPCPYQCPDKG